MWNVYSNLFGSSFRVISGALVQSNLLTYFRRNTRQKVKLLVRSRRGGRGRCPPGFANNCPILTLIRELYSIAFDDDGSNWSAPSDRFWSFTVYSRNSPLLSLDGYNLNNSNLKRYPLFTTSGKISPVIVASSAKHSLI